MCQRSKRLTPVLLSDTFSFGPEVLGSSCMRSISIWRRCAWWWNKVRRAFFELVSGHPTHMRVRILFLGVKFVYIIGFTVYIFFSPQCLPPYSFPGMACFFSHTLWGNVTRPSSWSLMRVCTWKIEPGCELSVRAGLAPESIQLAWSYDSCGDVMRSPPSHIPVVMI